MRALWLALVLTPTLALAQPRAPVLRGQFFGVVSAQGQQGLLSFSPALARAERGDVLRIEGRDNPAVYQSAQTVREVRYDIASPAGARIAEICASVCKISGTIEWREPNDWWFTQVIGAERLAPGFDFGSLSLRGVAVAGPMGSVSSIAATDPLHRTLTETLRAEMEVQLGQPLRFTSLAVRRQGQYAYVVVKPNGPEGGEVDFATTPWRDQWRYGPWDGGIIHALFHTDGQRWTLETYVISPVTTGTVGAWVADYRAPPALLNVDVRGAG